ncbi:holo-[acyl-carrier-protein] synthase [Alicyclobacillus sacchari]|uniref:Holo-[acyl-carrier-protein] synthase n=1 Tax=Alicyclobacillus sacchari TaxID=392010 RepID=A0A4R8LRC0_9BACL|nr:holo-ACP synthase [Alicyclobacillus sacchari]TDY50008.1 holo-[acyl-carrier-protein] synthase [Alicyclobacillus sacchari]GMA57672.1 holo-[acyl-carrier-protein] synthase [Alicyclobacillus sacchari]
MIIGLGTDLIEIHRVRQALRRNREPFLQRVLSESEQQIAAQFADEARLAEFVAGRFAAKEAIAKATGLGLGKLGMSTVSIRVGETGLVTEWSDISGLVEVAGHMQQPSARLHVSLSHAAGVAYAVAILEQLEQAPRLS